MEPIEPMFDMPVQPLTGHEPHGVLSVGEDAEPGGRPASGSAKGGTNPLTREIIEIAHRGEDLTPAADGFDPAEHDLQMLALIFRVRRLDEGPIDPDDHVLGGSLDIGICCDLGSRLSFDRLSYPGRDYASSRD